MNVYKFTKSIHLLNAFNNYLKTNFSEYDGYGYEEPIVTVLTKTELSQELLGTLTALVNDYTDPEYYLNFSRSESMALLSPYTGSEDVHLDTDGRSCLQTIIMTKVDDDQVELLDGIKTIFEYHTENVQNFIDTTSGSLITGIFDITRNWCIIHKEIDISDICTQFNSIAQTGSTEGSSIFQSYLFEGLHDKITNYDCIWQFRACSFDNTKMKIRMNGMQKLFYNKEV